MIEREELEGVTVLRLAHGKASALDLELCNAIASAFAQVAGEPNGIVLTGSGRIFSAGVDLVRLVNEGADYVREFLPALSRAVAAIVSCDRPVVAAVNGHAIAGGCILTAACDVRIMAEDSGTIGVPELLVGVPFPSLAVTVLRQAIPSNRQREVMLTGGTWQAKEAMERGLVDRVASSETLLDDAVRTARAMGRIEPAAFALAKDALLRPVREELDTPERDEIMARWTSPGTFEAIRGYLDRTVRRK